MPPAGTALDLDLAAELDDAVGRDAEVLGGVEHGVRHEDEELLAPAGEGGALRRDDLLAPQEERGLHQVEAELLQAALRQGGRDFRLGHEAVIELDDVKIVLEMADLDAALLGHVRDVLGAYVHQHDAFVQNLVVLEIMQQRGRHAVDVAGQKDRRARHPTARRRLEVLEEEVERHRRARALGDQELPTADPRPHHDIDDRGDKEREPAALLDLHHVGGEEGEIDDQEEAEEEDGKRPVPLQDADHVDEGENRGQRHRSGHRDAVGGAEIVRRFETEHQRHDGNQQEQIDGRYVDLAELLLRVVTDEEARQIAELHGLIGHRKSARDDGLRGDDGRRRSEHDQGKEGPVRRQSVERVLDRLGRRQQQAALAEIIEQQSRKDEAQPGGADRRAAEMAHIGIERLGAGHGQHHRTEQDETVPGVVGQQRDPVIGIERPKNAGLLDDLDGAQQADDDEPYHHDRTEEAAYQRRAASLHQEERKQKDDGDRQDVGLEDRRRDLETFDRAEHRDGRGDHPVTVEQRRTDKACTEDPAMTTSGAACRAQRQCGKREDAAFAAIVRAHDDDDIFDGDDDKERPGNQREHAVDDRRRHRADVVEALLDGIERRRPDIAIDDAKRPENEPLTRLFHDPPGGAHHDHTTQTLTRMNGHQHTERERDSSGRLIGCADPRGTETCDAEQEGSL